MYLWQANCNKEMVLLTFETGVWRKLTRLSFLGATGAVVDVWFRQKIGPLSSNPEIGSSCGPVRNSGFAL